MNYVPLTRDERTHEIKKLGEFNVNWYRCVHDLAITSVFRSSFVTGNDI